MEKCSGAVARALGKALAALYLNGVVLGAFVRYKGQELRHRREEKRQPKGGITE